jgi:hypothetical protein
MRLRYPGTCRLCGAALPAKADAIYERASKTVRCAFHEGHELSNVPTDEDPQRPIVVPNESIDVGTAGASARREYERRRARREERIRTAHPRIGGLIHAFTDDPQSTKAWDTGAIGEERLGRRFSELATETLRVLHDRRIPRSRSNIDHLAVTPSGVYVIDAKKYRGRPHVKVEGGFLRPRVEKLLVGTRDRTSVVDGVINQVAVVRDHLDDSTPILGVLCFVEADWPLIGGSFHTRGVDVLWPSKLYRKLRSDGPLDIATIAFIHRTLAAALPPA